jgi:hypothetical protein
MRPKTARASDFLVRCSPVVAGAPQTQQVGAFMFWVIIRPSLPDPTMPTSSNASGEVELILVAHGPAPTVGSAAVQSAPGSTLDAGAVRPRSHHVPRPEPAGGHDDDEHDDHDEHIPGMAVSMTDTTMVSRMDMTMASMMDMTM